MYKKCVRCIMDNISDDTITFDNNGICSYCNYALERMESVYFPNEEGKKKLESMLVMLKAEGKGKKFDCLMGLSGGLDSSYLAYLGYKWGLRILAFHVDDGFNTEIASRNLKNLVERCNIELVVEKPDAEQFYDVTRAFIRAGLPGICNPQDNIITSYILKISKKFGIKYFLSGSNFSMESILVRVNGINATDGYHIKAISKLFGEKGTKNLPIISLFEGYFASKYIQKIKVLRPLDFIDYNKDKALSELEEFCKYDYYGGKHYENILTHFAQVYYLPHKFNIDKRSSHLSSLVISGQLSREMALNEIDKPLYDKLLMDNEIDFVLSKLKISRFEFESLMTEAPKLHRHYPNSILNKFEGIARRLRKFLPDL